jgi:MFS family permease
LLLAINTMNFFDRQILGAVAIPVQQEFQLNDKEMGELGTAFTLLYAIVGVPLGRLADRSRRTFLLSGGVFVWSLLTAASGLARSFSQLYYIRLGVGVGEATCAPAATSLIGDYFPASVRGRAMSIFMLGLPLGIALSFIVSTTIAQQYDWRTAFFVAGVPGLLCAVAILFLKEPKRGAVDAHIAPVADGSSAFGTVLATPTVWWLILSGALHNFNMYALGAFLIALLQRYHELDIKEAGQVAMIAYGLSGVPGLLLGGWLADAFRARRVDGRLLVGGLAILIATPLTYVGLNQSAGQSTALLIYLGLGCAFMYVYYASVYPTLHDVVAPNHRGSAMALYFCAMYLLGASLGPYVMGAASDYFALQSAAAEGIQADTTVSLDIKFRALGLKSAMLLVPAINAALAVVLLLGCLTVRRDVARVSQQGSSH